MLLAILWFLLFKRQTKQEPTFSSSFVYSIGDLHGDLPNTLKLLRNAGLINGVSWSANNSILVQTGDIVDRGPDTVDLYRLFKSLADEAVLENGRVFQLLGNHEIMNMMNDLRYVDDGDVKSYGGLKKRERE